MPHAINDTLAKSTNTMGEPMTNGEKPHSLFISVSGPESFRFPPRLAQQHGYLQIWQGRAGSAYAHGNAMLAFMQTRKSRMRAIARAIR